MVLLHGFTQSADVWGPLAERLAGVHEVVALDLPGHGGSAGVRAGLWETADLVAEAGERAAYVGYSMGGRVALHVAVRHPELVRRLVLVSATAGIEDPTARAARVDADEEIARRVERDGVPELLRWWLSRPLFSTLPAEAAALEARLGATAEGLASSLRLAGAGRQEPLWDRLGEVRSPALVVAGELDAAYRALAERIVSCLGGKARLAVIPGTGHACHLEAPEDWLGVVGPFLSGTPVGLQ